MCYIPKLLLLTIVQAILFKFNAQHDCRRHKCKFVECSDTTRRGRVVTASSEIPLAMHAVDDDYFLNMHGIHNAHLIRETLPRELTAPRPYLSDRLAKHKELAAQLRISGPAKHAETNAKRAQTVQKNKQARESRNQRLADNGPQQDEESDEG